MKARLKYAQKRVRIIIKGTVQGVGFRPTVYRYAVASGLSGFVGNTANGVIVEVQGNEDKINDFIEKLRKNPPKNSKITGIKINTIPQKAQDKFRILLSKSRGQVATEISPDICICDDCMEELLDKKDRRYLYPFINCTNCGPRFTIIKGVPYDRHRTTMKNFNMCPDCRKEYDDPADRRFHAQPNACPECGPGVELFENVAARFIEPGKSGVQLNSNVGATFMAPESKAGLINQTPTAITGKKAIEKTVKLLKDGKIIAVKGLGGFHLACDATDDSTVKTLRSRKYREDKPFAVMARDIGTIKKYFKLSAKEEELLVSVKRPIVLIKSTGKTELSKYIAPGSKFIGLMLPYTPLHHLLFNLSPSPFPLPSRERILVLRSLDEVGKVRGGNPLEFLVMTSGNISDEPICYTNEDAFSRLKGIADYFLVHDRDIYIRCDDSVTRVFMNTGTIVRRSRGYVPGPVKSPLEFKRPVLACGAHLKNTFCLAKSGNIYISHHIGDLENVETLTAFEKGIEHFKKVFEIEPQIVAHDLHREYLSTKYALEYKKEHPGVKLVPVQHHHAHIASCLADNISRGNLKLKPDEKVIGVALDGTGYGEDGNVWGAEILIAGIKSYRRYAHLDYIPMPGGEQAIKEPWRMAAVFLCKTFGNVFLNLDIKFVKDMDRGKWGLLKKMIDSDVNSPLASSMGRLFDAVSSLIGIRDRINYEGQAAVELEQAINSEGEKEDGCYGYEIITKEGLRVIDTGQLFRDIIKDLQKKVSIGIISAKFHNTVASMIIDICIEIRKETGIKKVALSGGVFQNVFLLDKAVNLLRNKGFDVYIHSLVPANDGGLCLGQALIAQSSDE